MNTLKIEVLTGLIMSYFIYIPEKIIWMVELHSPLYL